jgi:caa(3)-type oxidase subunit IV
MLLCNGGSRRTEAPGIAISCDEGQYKPRMNLGAGLTLLTVGVAFLDLGSLNTIIALTIAVAKVVLVLLFFMLSF